MFTQIIAAPLIATSVAYPIVKDVVVDTPHEVIHINIIVEEKVDTTPVPTTTTTTVVVPTTTGLSFNKDDQLINWAWSDSGTHMETPYDSNKRVILLDGDVEQSKVQEYKDKGHIVIGYISIGSWEPWRNDVDDFSERVKGPDMDGWDEKWFNLEFWQDLKEPMTNRLKVLKEKGFDGYEGDNVGMVVSDANNTGFEQENIDYAKWLASTAHSLGMLAVMKNGNADFNLAEKVVDDYDAIIIEEAFNYNEVEAYEGFKDKPVWCFEYHQNQPIDVNKYDWINNIYYDNWSGYQQLK